jgi:hypothetical protein
VSVSARLEWEKIAQVFDLDKKTRDRTWQLMIALGISPDDPILVLLAVAGLIEQAAAEVPAAIKSIPERADAAAGHLVQKVLRDAIRGLRKNQEADAERIGEKIARQAISHFARSERLSRLRVSAEIAVAAAAIALACGWAGYALGSASLPAEWVQFAARPDAPFWRSLAEANPSLPGSIGAICDPGRPGAFVENGLRACRIDLWMENRAEPAQSVLVAARRYVGANGSGLLQLALGFLAAIFGQKIARRAATWRPVRWLFDR